MLTVFFGLPGSGKTTIARLFCGKTKAVLLGSDLTRKKFFSKAGYSRKEREKVYAKMQETAFFYLLKERHVVLDATFQDEKLREYVFELADIFSVKPLFFYCFVPEKTAFERLKKRNISRSLSDADINVYKKLSKEFNTKKLDFIKLDCSKPAQKILALALKHFLKRQKNE